MSKPALLIRADAGAQIGTGHVLRGLALAHAWQEAGGDAFFACGPLPHWLVARLKAENCPVLGIEVAVGSTHDATQTRNWAQKCGASWVVVDGYHFDAPYFQKLAQGVPVLQVDDYGAFRDGASALLNPNAGATADFYGVLRHGQMVLAGQEYALLRREFRLRKHVKRTPPPQLGRVLILMGGTDPQNLAPRVLKWLQRQNFVGEVTVLGGTHGYLGGEKPAFDLRWLQAEREVPIWMEWADVALAAAGSTTWEMASCGLPMLLTVAADNQKPLALWCENAGIGFNLGEPDAAWEMRLQTTWQKVSPPQERQFLSERAQKAIDGQGAARVVRALWPSSIQLRAATLDDARQLWEWRNEPSTRVASISPGFVTWETHRAWLKKRLVDPNTLLWMGQKDGENVGMARLERGAQKEAIISIIVDPARRGQGVGRAVIRAACLGSEAVWPDCAIRAHIKRPNLASQRAFEGAGFRFDHENSTPDVLEWVWERHR